MALFTSVDLAAPLFVPETQKVESNIIHIMATFPIMVQEFL